MSASCHAVGGGSRIAIDGHMIGSRETGNETYVVELAHALGRHGGAEYLLYLPSGEGEPPGIAEAGTLRFRRFDPTPAPIRLARRFPRLLAADRAALGHFTYITPPRSPCPVVVTVHDVSFRHYPEFFSPRVRLILGLLLGPSMRRARHVLTVSECSRQDIVRFYGISPARITVTPEAAGERFRPCRPDEVAHVRERYRLAERYVLAVGNVQPRKNLPRLVEAFAALADDAPDLQLVIAGQSAWRGSETEAAIAKTGLRPRVRIVGYVPDDDLPALYSAATVFCYPSLYEGFGLPALEAMACGAATVTSTSASLPEVVGDAALTVDPTSTAALAQALRALVWDDGLRAEYRGRGLARARQFSWERTAAATFGVYQAIIEGT